MMLSTPEALFEKNFRPGGFGFLSGLLHFVLPCHIFWPTRFTVICTTGPIVVYVEENRFFVIGMLSSESDPPPAPPPTLNRLPWSQLSGLGNANSNCVTRLGIS